MRFLLDESILIRQIPKKKSDGLKFRVLYGRVTKLITNSLMQVN